MTETQKQKTNAPLTNDLIYAPIGAETGVAPISLKSFFQRNKLVGICSNTSQGAFTIPDVYSNSSTHLHDKHFARHPEIYLFSAQLIEVQ